MCGLVTVVELRKGGMMDPVGALRCIETKPADEGSIDSDVPRLAVLLESKPAVPIGESLAEVKRGSLDEC